MAGGQDQGQGYANYGEGGYQQPGGPGQRATSPPMVSTPMQGGYQPYGQPFSPQMGYGAPSPSMGQFGSPNSPPNPGFEQAMGQFGAQFGQLGVLANPLAQMGLSQAQQFVASVNDSFVSRWTGSLRYYFSVNNLYVLHKLKILLFPFIHKSWSRKIVQAADGREMYLPPNQVRLFNVPFSDFKCLFDTFSRL